MQDFGIIVTCTKTDFLFAKGCCASIRYFMGNVPICLLVDGNFPVDSIARAYNTLVIHRKDVKNPLLATRSTGWGLTKMIAFWESPFQHFLLLDADTCVWGDVSMYADFKSYDAIVDIPCYAYSKETISEYFFDVKQIKMLFPEFNYQDHPYVCTGVIFGKKNMFSIDEYKHILDLKDKYPTLFKYGEMGFLNFMLFRAKQESRLKVGAVDTQYIVTDFDFEETKNRFTINEKPVLNNAPTVIHWAGGGKPVKSNTHVYSEPMTYFRKRFIKGKRIPNILCDFMLRKEDYLRDFQLQSNYYKKRINQIFKQAVS